MGYEDESGLGAYRFMLVICMTLYPWVPVGLCTALLRQTGRRGVASGYV